MAALGFELLYRFLWGSLLVLVFVSRKETSERFLRIASYIAIVTCVCASWLLWRHLEGVKIPTGTPLSQPLQGLRYGNGFWSLALLAASSLLYTFGRARALRILGFGLLFVSPMLLVPAEFRHVFNFLSGALVLGAAFGGQYLGHWYLTVPGMHIRELKKVSAILFFAVLAKIGEIAWNGWAWSAAHGGSFGVDDMGRAVGTDLTDVQSLDSLNLTHSGLGLTGESWLGLGSFGVILLTSRVLWGVIAPIILGYMIVKTVEMRSTQSATGILYALCVAVIFGEGAAIYMRSALGLFL